MNIGYKLIKNCMPATADKAPYLGMAIPVGSLAYDNILRKMVETGTKMTQPTAKYFLDALYEFAAEKIAEDAVRINLGAVSIYPMIDGSFDSEDAEFDPKRNSLYVGATLSQELRDTVAGIAPDFKGDATVGTVKLHSCMDLETQVFKVIRGTKGFRLAGANLTVPDGADESLALYAKNGVDKISDIVVNETDGGQQITCHLSDAVAVPKGTYKVRLASHGLDPTDPLTVSTLTVELAEEVPVTRPVVSIRALSAVWNNDEAHAIVEIENYAAVKGYTQLPEAGQHTLTAKLSVNGAPATEETFGNAIDSAQFMAHLDGANVGDTVTVTIEINPTKAEAYRAGTMEMSAIVA